MDILKVFGDNIKSIRIKNGLSQEKLAELCGLHRTYISDIERHSRNVSLDSIQKLASALGVECSTLLAEQKDIEEK